MKHYVCLYSFLLYANSICNPCSKLLKCFLLFRFLRKTFSLAHSYTQPDVVVFLGDLMDEGSKATRSEYESYFTRFQDIFYPSFLSRVILLPPTPNPFPTCMHSWVFYDPPYCFLCKFEDSGYSQAHLDQLPSMQLGFAGCIVWGLCVCEGWSLLRGCIYMELWREGFQKKSDL